VLIALVPLLFAIPAGAQIIRGGGRPSIAPSSTAGFGLALVQGWNVRDGASGASWDFGEAVHYGASLEKVVTDGVAVGLRATTASVPLRYTDATRAVDADANVSQLMASLHVASGSQFHGVFDLSAGATVYSSFRARTGGAVGPGTADTDFNFGLGYGFGYAFSRRLSVEIIQDVTTVVHQKSGLAASDDSSVRVHGTRIMARFGLGGR
jgi:hypothetical protein